MKIRFLWVGRTKEPFARKGVEKYLKLLSPCCEAKIVEIKDADDGSVARKLEKEGRRIVNASKAYTLLHEKGKEMTSKQFAGFLGEKASHDFVVGGAYGVSDEVFDRATAVISLSKMTFPHDMARIILLEQVYRAFTILQGKGYHH